MTRSGLHIHAKIGVLGLILLALGVQINFASRLLRADSDPDYVSSYESRLAPVKQALPKRGSVGYIEKRGDPIIGYYGINQRAIIHVNEYFLSQYALAPLVLVFNSTKPPLVLANLHDTSSRAELFTDMQLEMKEDFGNGILLFQNKR